MTLSIVWHAPCNQIYHPPPIVSSLLRPIAQNPGFTAVVIAVLALGVGANTAIFSVVNAVILNPFPYPKSEQLLFVGSTLEGQDGNMPVTYPDFLDFRESAQGFDGMTFASNESFTLTGREAPSVLEGARVSADAWDMLGVDPILGRVFTAAEDQPAADPVAVLSYDTWQSRFGGDEKVLNQIAVLNGRAHTIIGVMPAVFKFWGAEVWVPVGLDGGSEILNSRIFRFNSWIVARVKDGITLEAANTELALMAKQIALAHPESNERISASARLLSDAVTGDFQRPLVVLLIAVACVLLIACANVANLLLARTASRQREFAIRVALGATRGQLIRSTLLESLPLSLMGGVAGLIVGAWGLQGLLAFLPADAIPAEAQIEVNLPVVIVSLALTIGTMLGFSLMPAFSGTRPDLAENLQEGARGTTNKNTARLRSILIVAEVSLSLTLLVGAGLLIRSLDKLSSVDPGFDPENLLVSAVRLPEARYPDPRVATELFRDLVSEMNRLPNVDAVAATTNAPFMGGSNMPLLQEGMTYPTMDDLRSAQFSGIIGDYFQAQGVPIVKGRSFVETDRQGSAPVVIINEEAVRQFFPNQDPIGQRVMLGLPDNLLRPEMLPEGFTNLPWAEVIGVVRDMRHFGLQADLQPAVYFPIEQMWAVPLLRNTMILMTRTHDDPTSLSSTVRKAVSRIDPDQPVASIATMETIIGNTLRQSKFNSLLLGCFAGVALLLALVGIYGLVAWNVTQRTREIGIRQALGAQRHDVLNMVVRQGMGMVLLGIVIGIATSLALARGLQSMLFEVSAFDPWTFVGVGLLLAGVALVACLLPALRASRINPLEALRAE